MADNSTRISSRSKKTYRSEGISNLPKSPLGATPRPGLRQHYPTPPPPSEYKLSYSLTTTDTVDYGGNDTVEFTQLRQPEPTELPDSGESEFEGSTRKSLLILALTFLGALLVVGVVYASFPKLDS